MHTNETVQATLKNALTAMELTARPVDRYQGLQYDAVRITLELTAAYSASGNNVPGLGGRGLLEALALAEAVIKGEFDFSRVRANFKHLNSAFL